MATWDVTVLKNETCPNCQMVYSVKYISLPLKDVDQFTCSCGQVLRSWRETGMYTYISITNGSQ
jgi:hypothetical protein